MPGTSGAGAARSPPLRRFEREPGCLYGCAGSHFLDMDTSITLIGVRLLLQSQLKLATSSAGAVAGSLKVGCMPHRAQLRAQLLIKYRIHLY